MFYLIEDQNQLQELSKDISKECFINVIPLHNFYHPKLTSPSLIYYKPLGSRKGYMLCINHSESFKLDFNEVLSFLSKHETIYVLDKKFHLYFLNQLNNKLVDINFNRIDDNKKIINNQDYNTPAHNILYNKHKLQLNNVDYLVPISKHYEKWENIYRDIQGDFKLNNYYNDLVNVFFYIEKNEIRLDNKRFLKDHHLICKNFSVVNNSILAQYNLYNFTLRPTNSFNGINFSAIPKDKREGFIASNDFLLDIDHSEYHPRLIANEIGYGLPKNESIYDHVSKLLEISREEAKTKTFNALYGFNNIDTEFFNKIKQYRKKKWDEFCSRGYLELKPNRKLKIEEPTEQKILNYYIQNLETYTNIHSLSKIIPLLEGKKTKLIWYLYDSYLIDTSADEKYLIDKIKNILSEKFPIRISYGNNYKDMIKIE